MSHEFNAGDEVAIYRHGDFHGKPATVKIDRVSRVSARLYHLRDGRRFSRKTCADGSGDWADRLLPINDERVQEALRRQEFDKSVSRLVHLAKNLDCTAENKERVDSAISVIQRLPRSPL